ncbi:MAG: glycyl-radical enzyme activating protein [Clostridiales Family XIII bacterium]|nr:glycyl-radical enzyme activating protein [Clostridiales Family XIII bacterium]
MKTLIFNIVRGSFVDGHGIRTTVFLKGCPLRCLWCCNVEGQETHDELKVTASECNGCGKCAGVCPVDAIRLRTAPEDGEPILSVDRALCNNCGKCAAVCYRDALDMFGTPMTADEVFDIVQKDTLVYSKSGGGVTIAGGEATMQPEFTLALLEKCKKAFIHTAIDTCGYTTTDAGFQCLAEADLLLYDLKHMDSQEHQRLTGVPNELILENLVTLNDSGKDIIIRIPVIPGFNDSEQNLHDTAAFVADLKSVERVDLIGYHNYSTKRYEQLGREYPLTMPAADEAYMESVKSVFEEYGLHTQLGG